MVRLNSRLLDEMKQPGNYLRLPVGLLGEFFGGCMGCGFNDAFDPSRDGSSFISYISAPWMDNGVQGNGICFVARFRLF